MNILNGDSGCLKPNARTIDGNCIECPVDSVESDLLLKSGYSHVIDLGENQIFRYER